MFHPLRLVAALLLFLCALSPGLTAQPVPDDDGILYFPPKLTVHATGTNNMRPRESEQKRMGGTISLRRMADRQVEFLLPIIFFEGAGSTAIPERYQTFFSTMETDDYVDSGDVPEIPSQSSRLKYLEILNVLGYRMTAFPASRIELEGGYSTLPGETAEVGSTRAEVVRDYLTTIWKIAPERIGLRPPRRVCDSAANILRQEEAQRVTIIPSVPELIRPVRYSQIRGREELTFFRIMIDPAMDPADVAAIELAMSVGDEVISSTQIPGHPDSAVYNLQGLWPAFQLQTLETPDLVVQAFVRTWQGTLRSTNAVRIGVEANMRERDEYEPENPFASSYFALPFFDWRDSSLSGLQQYYLEEYIGAFRKSAEGWGGQPYNIRVNPAGDLSENVELDEAVITTTRALQTIRTTAIKSLFSPHSRFPIIFMEDGREPNDEVIVRTWLGEEYMNQVREQQTGYTEEFFQNPYLEFDSTLYGVLAGRGNQVARYLQERIGSALHDSITVGDDASSSYSYTFLPEDRYYERSVAILLEPYYEWNEEDEEYEYGEGEGYEYQEEGEYVPEEEYEEIEMPERAEEYKYESPE